MKNAMNKIINLQEVNRTELHGSGINSKSKFEIKNIFNSVIDLKDLHGPKGWPLVGNLFQLKSTQLHLILENWAKEYGSLYRLNVCNKNILVLSDPELIFKVLKNRPETFRRNIALEKVLGEMGIKGLLSAEGDQWRQQRMMTMQAFNPDHLRNYFPQMMASTEKLLNRWQIAAQAGKPIDVQEDLMSYSMDIIAGLAFGVDIYGTQGGQVIIQNLHKIFPVLSRRLQSPIPYWRFFKLPSDYALDHHLIQLRKAFNVFIDQARTRIINNPALCENPSNLIEALVIERDKKDSGFTDADVFGNVFTMLLLGEDSVASAITWIIHYLSENILCQKKLQLESDASLKSSATLQNFEQSLKLPYSDAVIQEVFRLKPVLPVMFLEPVVDAMVGQVMVPKGTPMVALLRAASLDDKNFDNPTVFNPDREYKSEKTPSRPIVLPFGAGPRICPARNLALLQIKMATSMLMRNFTIENANTVPVREHFSFTMQPTNVRVKLINRRN